MMNNKTCAEWCPECEGETEMRYEAKQQACTHCGFIQKPCAQCELSTSGDCHLCPFMLKEESVLDNGTQVVIKTIDSGLDEFEDVQKFINNIGTVTDNYKTLSGHIMYAVNIEIDGKVYDYGFGYNELELLEVKDNEYFNN